MFLFCTYCTVAHTLWSTSTFGSSLVRGHRLFLNLPKYMLWFLCPASCRCGVYQHADRRGRNEANMPVSFADLERDTAIRRYQAFYWQIFNLWKIKWTTYTHGLTSSGILRTAECWRLLRPGWSLRCLTRPLPRLDFPSFGRTNLRSQLTY